MDVYKIPVLTETSDQRLSVELDGNPYILRILWNERFQYFSLSIYEADETPILLNVKMVKNYDLTSRYKDVRLPYGSFSFIQENGNAERPTYSDLGVNFGLYYVEPDAPVVEEQVRIAVAEPVIGTIWDSGLSTWDSDATSWDD